jgi:histone chaperone ASF1
LQELDDDLEWKVLYVGSAHDSHQDQVLDEILVGPVPVGMNKFVLQADPPDINKIPEDQLLGVTVVLVTCSYKEREFIRVGYYVNNEYTDPAYQQAIKEQGEKEGEEGEAPAPPALPPVKDMNHNLIQRHILADKPRVTKFPIPWGNESEEEERPHQEEETMMMKEDVEGTPSTTATSSMDVES